MLKRTLLLTGTALGLLCLVAFGIRQYEWNVSGLLHMDAPFGERHDVPVGIVLYEDAGYDGMLYYQIARDLPALVTGKETSLDSPYRFQRILLPLIAYLMTFGHEWLFPAAFLAINLAATIGTLALMLSITKKPSVHSLTVVANPAMLVGILYSVTEPLSTFFIVLFFKVWLESNQKLTALGLCALLLSLLARETTVFLIGLLFLWFLWKKQWKQALLILLPLLLIILWQYILVLRLGAVGFQANSNIVAFPFLGPLSVLQRLPSGEKTSYLLSSVGLLLFVLPLCAALGREWIQKRLRIGEFAFLLSGLIVTMLSMDEHMWGAITSIGRVVTPLYPVYALYAAERDTWMERGLSATLIVVSVVAAIGIAAVRHPYHLS